MGKENSRKVFILLLVCILLVLSGCSSNGTQNQVQYCSVSQIDEVGEYYNQQHVKVLDIVEDVGPYDPVEARQQVLTIYSEVLSHSRPACARIAYSYLETALSHLAEAYKLIHDSNVLYLAHQNELAKKTMDAANVQLGLSGGGITLFFEEIDKMKANLSEP